METPHREYYVWLACWSDEIWRVGRHRDWHFGKVPIAGIGPSIVGEAEAIADHVCSLVHRVRCRLLSDLDDLIDLNPKVPNDALDLGMSKQKLDGAEIASAALDQHCPLSDVAVRNKMLFRLMSTS